MKTLYDLLGALPSDDAEGLRTAFRRAVKGAHPDIHPDDPDAALKFRQIVRASEILCDTEQRTAYDHLLGLARLEEEPASDHAIAARIYKVASGVMVLTGVSVVTVGGYLLFMHMSAASVAPANEVDVAASAPVEMASVSPAGSPDMTDKSASPATQESTSVRVEAIAPISTASQPNAENVPAANVGPAPDPAASEVPSLRARGILAYRKSDLNGAIADLNKAVQFDPRFSADTYIDYRTIFYRLRKFERALAGVAGAKRIEQASRTLSAPKIARRPHFDQAAIELR